MKLRIRNVQKDDFMEYRCVAKNSLGGSDGTITLYGKLIAATNHFMRIKMIKIYHTQLEINITILFKRSNLQQPQPRPRRRKRLRQQLQHDYIIE